jgi:MFS family permease
MVCNTQKGLYFLIIGSIITMIYSAINSLSSFFTQDLTTQIIIGFLAIVSFIGAILILVGLILFLMGRKEFGEKHQNNVKNAVIIFCITIIVAIILVVAIAFVTFSAISSAVGTSSTDSFVSPSFSIVIITLVVVTAVLGGLMYYFGLIELENETGKNILFAGIISSIIISIITSFYLVGMLGEIFGSISSPSSYSSLSLNQNFGGIGILGIIPSLLFLYAFYIPYNRIKNGELIPKTFPSGQSQIPSRICPNCGRPIPMDSNVCPYCGKKFEKYS